MREKIVVTPQSLFGGKRAREESEEREDQGSPFSPYRPQKFANPFKFFESHINNTPEGGDLHENEELERPEAPQKNNNDDYGAPGRDNPSEVRIEEPHTKTTKNDNAPNDDCDIMTSSLPSSLQGPRQDETLNNDSSRSLAPVFYQQGNISNCDNEKKESSSPSSSTELRSETPCKQLKFNKLKLSNA